MIEPLAARPAARRSGTVVKRGEPRIDDRQRALNELVGRQLIDDRHGRAGDGALVSRKSGGSGRSSASTGGGTTGIEATTVPSSGQRAARRRHPAGVAVDVDARDVDRQRGVDVGRRDGEGDVDVVAEARGGDRLDSGAGCARTAPAARPFLPQPARARERGEQAERRAASGRGRHHSSSGAAARLAASGDLKRRASMAWPRTL